MHYNNDFSMSILSNPIGGWWVKVVKAASNIAPSSTGKEI